MVNVAEKTLNEVDVVLWLVEPTNFIGAGEQHIIEQLKKVNTPVILIINKVDTVEKEKVLEYIDTYRKVYDFAEIIPTSALRGRIRMMLLILYLSICLMAHSSMMRTPSQISRSVQSVLRLSGKKRSML